MKYTAIAIMGWLMLAVLVWMYRGIQRYRRVNILAGLMDREFKLARKAMEANDLEQFAEHLNYRKQLYAEAIKLLRL